MNKNKHKLAITKATSKYQTQKTTKNEMFETEF